jgi:hypothetical protein
MMASTKRAMRRQRDRRNLRERLTEIVEKLAEGSQEPAHHTHIECNCPGLVHRTDEFEEGCFCPECASEEAVKRGLDAEDIELENEGPDDNPKWCQNCDRLITLRTTPDLLWGITPEGALEELEHFETGLGAEKGEPKTPDDWRVFLLLVDSIDETHLRRVEAVINRATNSKATPARKAVFHAAR